ncbi:MAG: hybrid sensor histidine kinase/response regulator [Tannerellaceae bacterium]|nr:hybrid sensor histidine kinase/response regulator [Tannerellaceae bacterium]
MLQTVESKIRLKAILIYIIVAAFCCEMVFYTYHLRDSIDSYKNNIEEHNTEIAQTDSLIQFINKTQQEANQYVLTRRTAHLRQFHENLSIIEFHLDSLQQQEIVPFLSELMEETNLLLREKGDIIRRLNRQFIIQNTSDNTINELLSAYEPVQQTDSIIISSVQQDTTYHVPLAPKRNIFQRIFSSKEQETDTIFSISTIRTDTVVIVNQSDTIPMLSEISTYTEQIKDDYKARINSIQAEVNRLLMADQEISIRISSILINLYSNSIRNILGKVYEQEEEIRRTNSLSLLTGGIALALILLFILLIFSDVSKSLRNRQKLEEANRVIRQTMDSRHKLLLSVSHDIKTPLNSILGYLDIAQKPGRLSSQEISTMKSAGNYILTLLTNLLEYSGLEQGMMHPSPIRFNLYDVCKETVDICSSLAQKKGLNLIYNLPENKEIYLIADAIKIRQIVVNILSNAIKYTNEGNVILNVTYEAGRIAFTIEDSGMGMDKTEIEKLFQPFTRMDSHQKMAEGTGIGMYVVKGLTELLNGTIRVESVKEKGTTITVSIPVTESEKIVPQENTSKRILLIDDNPSFLLLLKEMINQTGHQPDVCHTPEEFKEKIQAKTDYDMVITDMDMGNFSGMNVLKLVRNINPDIPVIIMTGDNRFDYTKAIEAGFTNHFSKPVSLLTLIQILGGEITTSTNEFELLEEMFGNDRETIREILETFISSSFLHIDNLLMAMENNDFTKAQKICHTMLPMCMQLNCQELTGILKQIDGWRNREEEYPDWKQEIKKIIPLTGTLIERIQTNYPDVSSSLS